MCGKERERVCACVCVEACIGVASVRKVSMRKETIYEYSIHLLCKCHECMHKTHLQLAAFQLEHAMCVRVVVTGAKADAIGNSITKTRRLPIFPCSHLD